MNYSQTDKGGASPLGIIAKCESSPVPQGFSADGYNLARVERWLLKRCASTLLGSKHRTCQCNAWFAPSATYIPIIHGNSGRCSYRNLVICGHVWTCPLCAARITEGRRIELNNAMNMAKVKGLSPYLITLTFAHGKGDSLPDTLDAFGKARKRLFTGRSADIFRQLVGYVGMVRTIEITHGQSGWHPHAHILLFASKRLDTTTIWGDIAPRWKKALNAFGLDCDLIIGCKVDDGSRAQSYVSKWGMPEEMTKGHLKKSRDNKGKSIWDLLRSYGEGDKQSGALFVEFAKAFKGQRQLHWSHGLKEFLGVVVEEDSDLAQKEIDTNGRNIAGKVLVKDIWKLIRQYRLESELLAFAEKMGVDLEQAFQPWLEEKTTGAN